MEKVVKIYDSDRLFTEIMQYCVVDNNIDNWERDEHQHGYEHARPLIDTRTGHHFGWLVFEQAYDNEVCGIIEETYITLEEK